MAATICAKLRWAVQNAKREQSKLPDFTYLTCALRRSTLQLGYTTLFNDHHNIQSLYWASLLQRLRLSYYTLHTLLKSTAPAQTPYSCASSNIDHGALLILSPSMASPQSNRTPATLHLPISQTLCPEYPGRILLYSCWLPALDFPRDGQMNVGQHIAWLVEWPDWGKSFFVFIFPPMRPFR